MSAPANVCVVIPAAGLGERLGLDQPKAFVSVNNWSLLSLTIRRVLDIARVGHLIVAVPLDFKTEALEHIDRAMRDANKKIPFDVVVGGETRTQSVKTHYLPWTSWTLLFWFTMRLDHLFHNLSLKA